MSHNSAVRRPVLCIACVFICVVPLLAQTSILSTERASITIAEEHHHHLEFENSYVCVFFVEIPAHESTLFHRHDFPYLSVPPTGADAAMPPSPGPAGQETGLPMIGYSPGNFSHAVGNSRDFALRNVAIELLRPQGKIRNGCVWADHNQPRQDCEMGEPRADIRAMRARMFETDEISVAAWRISPNITMPAWDDRADILLASLSGVSVTASGGIDSVNALKGGLLWLPAGSKPVFKSGATDGHFITITFKDSGSHPGSPSP